jgi:hypothetical protein
MWEEMGELQISSTFGIYMLVALRFELRALCLMKEVLYCLSPASIAFIFWRKIINPGRSRYQEKHILVHYSVASSLD